MNNYFLSFLLVLLCINGSYSYARNEPANFKSIEGYNKRNTTDSLNRILNRIHTLRNASPDSTLKVLYSIYNTCVQIGYLEGIGATCAEIGGTFFVKGDYKKAEKYILYSQLLPGLNEYISTNAINNLYLIYEGKGDYNLALKYLKKAMKSKDKNVSSSAYNNYIVLLLKLGRYKESLYYFDILKTKAKTLKQNRVLAALLCNEASVYSSLKDYKKFDSISEECLKICTAYNFEDILIYSYINSGTSYYERGQVNKAVNLFSGIKDSITKLDPEYQMNYHAEYGKMLYNTGLYNTAIDHLNKGILLASQIGIKTNIEPVYYLAKSYMALGNHATASKHLDHYIRLKDSFQNMEIQKSINEYEVKFRIAEKDNELLNKKLIILSQSNKINSKNMLILSSVVSFVILLILFFTYHKYTRQNRLMLKRDLDLAEQKANVNFLKAMIQGEEKERKRIGVELHNGVGSQLTAVNLNLTAFQWKNKHIPEVDSLNEIITQIQQTAIEVRKTAHNLLPAGIVASGLYHAIKEFTLQFKNTPVEINISKSGDLDVLNTALSLIVYRILQELISNAIKHAEADQININLKLANNILSATVTDNGKGFDLSHITQKGLGIQQIKEQLNLLKGTFKIHTQPLAGTTIYFEVDLKHSKNNQLL
ncbi:MAG: ATP-binding protein [Taibaiella sp.]|jgi:signal transduction histidine kinase